MKESYTLLDANVIIALLDRKDSLHKKAVEEITKLNNNTNFAIISPILTESYSVLVRRCIERKINCKEAILSLKEIEEVVTIFHPKFDQFHKKIVSLLIENPKLNYNDWLLYLFSKKYGFKFLSFDKNLLELL